MTDELGLQSLELKDGVEQTGDNRNHEQDLVSNKQKRKVKPPVAYFTHFHRDTSKLSLHTTKPAE